MDPFLFEVVSIALFVALSALFSGMETALVSLSEVKLRARAEDDEKLPLLLRKWMESPNDVLATLLIGNNLVNITASALATHMTERMLRDSVYAGWGIPIAVGIMTLLILIVGEVVPKTFAKHHPDTYTKVLPLLNLSYWFFFPLMIVLVALTRAVVRWMGGNVDAERVRVTEEDIEEMVRVGNIDGSLDPEAGRLLTGVLELDDKVSREIMVPRSEMHSIKADEPLSEVLKQVTRSGFSRYPVYRDTVDDVVGVLYAKDLLVAMLEHGEENVEVTDIMRAPLVYPENVPVEELLLAMKRERIHLAIIASEYGGVAGIVTLEDIVEEVFGDIYDEHDQDIEPMRVVGDGAWLVSGVVTIADLEDELGITLGNQDEDYETIAGLLMKAASRVPEPGFTHETDGIVFEVLHSDTTRLLEVAVRLKVADAQPNESSTTEAVDSTIEPETSSESTKQHSSTNTG